jgi:hypothetical protein
MKTAAYCAAVSAGSFAIGMLLAEQPVIGSLIAAFLIAGIAALGGGVFEE